MKRVLAAIIMSFTLITSIFSTADQAKTVAAQKKDNGQMLAPSGIAYEEIGESIDEYIETNKDQCASVSAAVFSGNETLYQKQYGYCDIEQKRKIDDETVYEWGSVSKLFVWISAMQLYEQGRLDLDQDIKEILPKDFFTKLSYDDPITMRELMNHQGGWQEITANPVVYHAEDIPDLQTALKRTEPIQSYRPGTVTTYSNWGAALAAYVVELVSQEEFVTYVHKNILEPLKMEHTSIGADHTDTPWVAEQRKQLKCYSFENGERKALGNDMGYIIIYPAGSVTGTFQDFITFAKTLAQKEGKTPLFEKMETLNLMREATDYFGASDIPRCCHGLLTQQFAVDVMGHTGNTDGCSATLLFNPESELGVCVLTNVQAESTFCSQMLPLVFGEYEKNQRVSEEKITQEEDLSVSYVMSRAYTKGRYSLLQYVIFKLLEITPKGLCYD